MRGVNDDELVDFVVSSRPTKSLLPALPAPRMPHTFQTDIRCQAISAAADDFQVPIPYLTRCPLSPGNDKGQANQCSIHRVHAVRWYGYLILQDGGPLLYLNRGGLGGAGLLLGPTTL